MSSPGETDDLAIRTRAALLDALQALDRQRDSVIVIGAQAVYLRTGSAPVDLAESTKDADLAIDPRELTDDPLIESAMRDAGFELDPAKNQPGSWITATGIPVDLMVPEAVAGPGNASRRAARLPPHSNRALRRARGLEAALIDNYVIGVTALDPDDGRQLEARVAGPAALLVAKVHKISERLVQPDRINDKDAHDCYRIFVATETEELVPTFKRLLDDDLTRDVTREALIGIQTLFADGISAEGSVMAGRAEEGIGQPDQVALSTSVLAKDLLDGVGLGT
jgi:hypothetical protein